MSWRVWRRERRFGLSPVAWPRGSCDPARVGLREVCCSPCGPFRTAKSHNLCEQLVMSTLGCQLWRFTKERCDPICPTEGQKEGHVKNVYRNHADFLRHLNIFLLRFHSVLVQSLSIFRGAMQKTIDLDFSHFPIVFGKTIC